MGRLPRKEKRQRIETEMQTPLEKRVHFLSLVDFLEPLPPEEAEELARRCPDTHLERGEIFSTPEEYGERLFFFKKGKAQVYEVDSEGQEIPLAVAEGGTVFGEMTLTGQRLSGFYARALEVSVLCTLKRRELEHLILRNPVLSLKLVRLLGEQLRATEDLLAELNKSVLARLASLIVRLLESEGVKTDDHYEIPTHYTHQQLAAMIGATRVAVTQAFSKLREAEAVNLRARRIHVVDLETLKRVAEEGKEQNVHTRSGLPLWCKLFDGFTRRLKPFSCTWLSNAVFDSSSPLQRDPQREILRGYIFTEKDCQS
jgi:CRP/FNR family transcriptional regulator, cyclic AMP receptor protein